jgi:quinol monooxygenase YgiN
MTTGPVVRISRGHFSSERYDEVRRFNEAAAEPLVPALKQLRGLIYYHVAVDPITNTVVNVSIWTDLDAAKQMDTLAPMLALRPGAERIGIHFDPIANYEPLWTIHASELGRLLDSSNPAQG